MKLIKFITHPSTIIISFFTIMISGQHLGGFYLFYLLLALPHGSIHSLLALLGVVLLLLNYYKCKTNFNYILKRIMNITGLALLILSLVLFFHNDQQHYNYDTFYQTVPQITLIIFTLLALIFLVDNVILILKNLSNKDLDNKFVEF